MPSGCSTLSHGSTPVGKDLKTGTLEADLEDMAGIRAPISQQETEGVQLG